MRQAKVLVLGSDFRKQGEEKIKIYYSMHVLVALDLKQLCHEDASAVANLGDLDPRAMPCRVVVGGSH